MTDSSRRRRSTTRRPWRRVDVGLALAIALSSAACSGSPTEPTRVTLPTQGSPATGPVFARITVIDGWTGASVANALVSTANASDITDGAGQAGVPVSCVPATFRAAGFLERRVRCLSDTVVGGRPVTLWPIRDEAESLATRHFRGGMTSGWPDEVPTYLGLEIQSRAEVLAVWQSAAAEIRRLTADRWPTPRLETPGILTVTDDYYVIRPGADQSACDHPWYTGRVPFDRFGFCMGIAPAYFAVALRVAEARLAAPEVALRTLLYASGALAHEFPGLLNESQPAARLSEFERKTLHMVGQRGRIGWPDDETCPTCQ